MPAPNWSIARIRETHDLDGFDSGNARLDSYLRKSARQDDRREFARTYVATRPGKTAVLGYYTVRNGTVEFRDPPDDVERRLPKYPVPVVRLIGLAVTAESRAAGLGARLLVSALQLSLAVSAKLDVAAVEVVAEDGQARDFYGNFGFKGLPEQKDRMYLSLDTLK